MAYIKYPTTLIFSRMERERTTREEREEGNGKRVNLEGYF
jgi:hypothetical protein